MSYFAEGSGIGYTSSREQIHYIEDQLKRKYGGMVWPQNQMGPPEWHNDIRKAGMMAAGIGCHDQTPRCVRTQKFCWERPYRPKPIEEFVDIPQFQSRRVPDVEGGFEDEPSYHLKAEDPLQDVMKAKLGEKQVRLDGNSPYPYCVYYAR